MYEIHQLASAMLAIAFAAVMLVAGQLFIEYRANKYPVVQTTVILSGVMIVAVNLVVDLLYAVIDPRIRYER